MIDLPGIPQSTEIAKASPSAPLGMTGLRYWGARVDEEFLPDLRGPKAAKVFREMADNDPVVGAVLFATTMLLRNVTWTVEGASPASDDERAAQFVGECIVDMDQTWPEFISEVLSMLPYGWSLFEKVYKRRDGKRSAFDDGLIGWAGLPIRSQDSLYGWVFDESGSAVAFQQLAPPKYIMTMIPLEKCLLFRASRHKNNPEGRALDPTTPILTPDGWRPLDSLHEGDAVFDDQGRVRYILARADWEDRPSYMVRFNDGSLITADAEHRWHTLTQRERNLRRPGRVRSTAEIRATLRTGSGITNHAIPWAQPVRHAEQALPIDPYLLGLWLGDGDSNGARISCHADDVGETAALIGAVGYSTEMIANGPTDGNGRMLRVFGSDGERWASDGPQSTLRLLGLIGNKHIPEAYLLGSVEQRRALLAGLMDSDGTVDGDGRCEFSNTKTALIESTAHLVRSLGCAAFVGLRHRADEITDVAVGQRAKGFARRLDSYAVKFTPDWPPFRLARKIERCKEIRARRFHYITDVIPVAPRRTICIEVDGPSHLFLAGRSLIPTHNSILRTAYRPWFYKKNIEDIEGIGISRDLAGFPVVRIPGDLMLPDASAEKKATFEAYKQIAKSIKRDEQEGLVLPSDTDERGNKLFDLSLLSTGSRRQFDTSAIIQRKNTEIAMSVLADFVMLGHGKSGSWALASDKTEMFGVAIGAWLGMIKDTINRDAIPPLLALNGIRGKCTLEHGDIEAQDVTAWTHAVAEAVTAGVLRPDPALEAAIRQKLGLPVLGTASREAGAEPDKMPAGAGATAEAPPGAGATEGAKPNGAGGPAVTGPT